MTEVRQSADFVSVYGAPSEAHEGERPAPAAPAPAPSPSTPPSVIPAAGGTIVEKQARVEALRAQLLPGPRAALLPEMVEALEEQYFKAIEDLHAPAAAPHEAAPMAAPPVVPLDAQQWERRLGPVRGPDNDFEVPEGSAWDPHLLNTAQSVFTAHGFPASTVDDFADAERQMAATSWSEEEGRQALVATHGPATAQRMIDNANVMLEIIHEHPLGRERLAKWEAQGGYNHPALVEALSNALNAQPRDNDRYMDLVLKRAARWQAHRRGQE